MKQKILFIGGGTGGHIMPLIPLVENTPPNWEVHLLTDDTANDETMVQDNFDEQNIIHHMIRSGKIRAYFSFKNFLDIPLIFLAILKSFRLLKKVNPDVLFFKGGYVGFAMVIAHKVERFLGTKHRHIFLHESDITPGKLHRMIKPISDGMFFNFGSHPLFYYEQNSEPGLGQLPDPKAKKKLVVFGGSGGAQWINESIVTIAPQLTSDYDITLVTGKGKSVALEKDIKGLTQHELLPQTELFNLMAKSDMIITRAGASIFQILYLQKPCLIIPLPGSARNHQVKNAEHFKAKGLCHTLDQTKSEPSDILLALQALEADTKLSKSLKQNAIKPADKKIWKVIETSLGKV